MRLSCQVLAALLAVAPVLAARRGLGAADGDNPITRVVKLLTEMKEQVEVEAKEDEEIYEKMDCWCKTNRKEKTVAVKTAQRRIADLETAIEEGKARRERLTAEIADIREDMEAAQNSIDTAAALREKEKSEFEEVEKDLTSSIEALREANKVLAKVQLLQKQGKANKAATQLLQVKELVGKATEVSTRLQAEAEKGVFKAVMQKDLWDFMSIMPAASVGSDGRVITGLEQQPTGAAAGATSYSARSSSIFGMLQQMQENFEKDLGAAHKGELEAEIAFQKLRSSKEGELRANAESEEMKTTELANTDEAVAQAKVDLEATKKALDADEKFLLDLEDRCKDAGASYEERSKTRLEEVKAIAEAIEILTEDDARDVFSRTTFVQIRQSKRHKNAILLSGREQQERVRVSSALLAAARKYEGHEGGWRLATLAVGVQLDGFTKVKQVMDNMIAELKKQQKEEYEKHEVCKKDFDENEDETRVTERKKKDLETQITGLEGTVASLTQELEDLDTNTKKAHVTLKQAGEQRGSENRDFQQVVSDQRATVSILQKAEARLQAFYASDGSLIQRRHQQEPGAAAPPPPPAGNEYSKSGGAGGVLQIIAKVIQDAQVADKEAMQAEQQSQAAYEQLVKNVNTELQTMADAITEKTIAKEKGEAEKLIAQNDLKTTEGDLENLAEQKKAIHLQCDFVVKFFKLRQQSRQEEIEAIQEAKAILSGADFGGPEEQA